MGDGTEAHWRSAWDRAVPEQVSWFQHDPAVSVELIERVSDPGASVVDVGGGASRLVDRLVADGYGDVTVLDVADGGLAASRARLGPQAARVTWIVGDITTWQPPRTFDVWHDRAVLHFLVDDGDRDRYLDALRRAVAPGGHVVLATFAPDGPEMCSGLPVRRYDVDAMAAALGTRFSLVDSVSEAHLTPAGGTQQFVYGLFAATS